jgi:hypothetical protein
MRKEEGKDTRKYQSSKRSSRTALNVSQEGLMGDHN